MLLDLRSLWEEQPAATTSHIGAKGRRLKTPYTDAPGNPPRHIHQTGRVGWKQLSGTRRVKVKAAAGSAAGAAMACQVRLQPRPIPYTAAVTKEAGPIYIPVVRSFRESPTLGHQARRLMVRATAGSSCGAIVEAKQRIGQHQLDEEDLLMI